jgi:hypothetical protein
LLENSRPWARRSVKKSSSLVSTSQSFAAA